MPLFPNYLSHAYSALGRVLSSGNVAVSVQTSLSESSCANWGHSKRTRKQIHTEMVRDAECLEEDNARLSTSRGEAGAGLSGGERVRPLPHLPTSTWTPKAHRKAAGRGLYPTASSPHFIPSPHLGPRMSPVHLYFSVLYPRPVFFNLFSLSLLLLSHPSP